MPAPTFSWRLSWPGSPTASDHPFPGMSETERMRLDEALVAAGLAPSRARARDMVLRGTVTIDGEPAGKPARRVGAAEKLEVHDPAARYVSRAAQKLAAGLDAFGFD